MNSNEYFKNISKIQFEGVKSKNPLSFRYYDKNRIIQGRSMKDWLRFSIVYWHTFRGTGLDIFGSPTLNRPWNNLDGNIEEAKQRAYAAFEFFTKIGVEYYTFHDRDIAPEGNNLKQTNKNLDLIVEELKKLQDEKKIKLLGGTSNMFSHPRNANGA